MKKYVLSPVAYNPWTGGETDRAFDPMEFNTIEEAEKLIADMGSRWILYPNIEILKRDTKNPYSISKMKRVKGFDSFGNEYK